MEKITFDQLKEQLFHEKLPNGLEVFLLPKEGFNKTYATFTTKYGSIDNRFVPLGRSDEQQVPDGIAHFLEHKLFEKEDGDVFAEFSKHGASANAFTSFTRTAYLFSSTSNVKENLEILLDFVQSPYFSEQSVEKEKGIIGQEITMYDDNPDWRVYYGLIENMYKNHPVKIDIAGTIESISNITKDLLYTCYETFYHPSNMLLFVVGPINPEEMIQQIRDNQAKKQFARAPEIKRFFDPEPLEVAEAKRILAMPVQTSKCLAGFKTKNPTRQGIELLQHELTVNVLLDLLFGKSSSNYEKLYDEGLIDDTFSFDYSEEYGFGFAMIGGDTENPDELSKRIQTITLNFDVNSISKDYLSRIKKKKIGAFLRALNSPEYIANQFTRYQFNGMNLFDIVSVLEDIEMARLDEVAKEIFDEKCFTEFQVVPK
ncbi:EF-P 5-aminopentanol modification-associated protein YfmH [Calidifontibacillus oryziterrae]|uniref:EF-P 5-aminopentanol modification-associated protein YfmH n=1 Tax=Calidifontibacillus oryziterrae TaxID=1191699 RepID=UPI000305C70F|nr:pitrilysin family protein [Calidifontibacillus oryziterrae]